MKKRRQQAFMMVMAFLLIFSNLNIMALAQDHDNLGDWEFSAFGSNTGEDKNPAPVINEDGSVTIEARGGKIASSEEGLSYYYKQIPADANFEITTTASVDDYSPDSQRSFGLMLRDTVGEHRDSGTSASNYIAVGALDDAVRGFYSVGGKNELDAFEGNNTPTTNETYELTIKKSGDTFLLSSNGESETIEMEGLFNEDIHLGFYVARDGVVTFSDTNINVNDQEVSELSVDASNMKTTYLVDEELDTTGLNVTATYADGSEEELSADDYILTGFDSSQPGTNTITVNYNGVEETIDLTIEELALTDMDIKYYPAKTDYYIGDVFDPEGIVVTGEYNDGYQTEELNNDQYSFSIDGETVGEDGFVLEQAGTVPVTVFSTSNPEVSTEFDVEVKNADLSALEIRQEPAKTQYFLGEELDLSGISVAAVYSDGGEERVTADQFEVSELDTTTTGDKTVTISYKGQEATFTVNVKERELTGIEVTGYPDTTYQTGEEFDPAGLEVSRVYDNGEEEVLSEEEYALDTSAFDSSAAGTYEITITPNDGSIDPVSFAVTVREAAEPEWQTIQFGQSTSSEENYVETLDDGSIRIVAESGAGKITGDHDGITFYYTEIDATEDNFELSADIKVNEYAKTPNHDGQESFGIMARDAIGTNDDSSVFASNIAAIGGFSGGTQEDNGTQLFIRTGVDSPDGAGSQGVQKIMLENEKPVTENTHPAEAYNLTLSKTNSGYTGQLNDGEEAIFFEPEILNVQDSKVYVGFYTARLADIEVSNIDFSVSAAETDPPRVDPPAEPVEPAFDVVSRDKASESAYDLLIESNVNGTLTVKQNQQTIAENVEVMEGETLSIPAELPANADTNFSMTFLPDDTQNLTSYDKLVKNFTVSMKTFMEGEDIHVSPAGTSAGTGTMDDPLDLDTAVEYVQPGQKIILADGDYVRNSKLDIAKYNDGTEEAMKYLVAAEGATPVIDFDKKSEGVILSGDYWHVKGIDFARSAGNTKGFVIGGDHNIIEDSRFYEHGDTGLQISRTDNASDMEDWPSHNLILNSTSFDNRDPSDNNADGFAAKLTSGVGNIFRGTIAHNNIDDGWDLYTKAGTGAIGAVVIEDSIAYNNGFLSDGTEGDGDKNGFKLGGEGIHVPHEIRNSIAFGNGASGFTSNSNPGVIAENNKAYNNEGGNLTFTTYANNETDFTIDGFISYQTDYNVADSYPEELESDENYFFDGSVSQNASGDQLTDESFVSLDPDLPFERDAEGNIIVGDFLKLVEDTEETIVEADVEFNPSTLKLKNNGNGNGKGAVATVRLQLPEGVDLEDVELDTILLNDEIKPITDAKKGFVKNPISGGKYMVKFSRADLASVLEKGNDVPITISGETASGEAFEGTTSITVK